MTPIIGRNAVRVRNSLLMVTLCVSFISLITEYVVEVLLQDSLQFLLIDFLNLFSVNLEESIPTWYATLLLFVAAMILFMIAYIKWREYDHYRWFWAGLAVGFLYLSMDEGAGIHEIFVDPMKALFNPGGFFAFGWQIVAIPVVLIVILLYARFIFHLPSYTRAWLVISASFYLGGALIVEGISANLWDINDGLSMAYLAVATIEELFEKLGVVFFIYTLLAYMQRHTYSVVLNYDKSGLSSQKASIQTDFPKVILLLAVLNIVSLAWMMSLTTPLTSTGDDAEQIVIVPFYYSIQDQILNDSGVIVDTSGIFGVDNPMSLRLGATLLEQYSYVVAISQPVDNITTLIATHSIMFSRDELADLLHLAGQTNFIIFDTDTVRAISQVP